MNPVQRATWFIETHFREELSLEAVADASHVSRYHLARVFAAATGCSPMSYVRGRRLSEAAMQLADGAPDILAVALGVGYGSHEAFTRAFREQFGLTPEQVRHQGHTHDLTLMEPLKMNDLLLEKLEPPRFEQGRALLIAGLSQRYNSETSARIPDQWQRFGPHIGRVPGQIGQVTYGICYNGDDQGNIDYICGVEVSDFSRIPDDWGRLSLEPRRYAVFTHKGHISGIRRSWQTILNQWLPENGIELARAPDFERYDERFDGHTGLGGVEIWIPVKD